MSTALEAHDKLLRQILKRHFGYEVSAEMQLLAFVKLRYFNEAGETSGTSWEKFSIDYWQHQCIL